MSWDVALVKIRGGFRPIEEVATEDYISLGTAEVVRDAIISVFPTAEWSNQTNAYYPGEDFSITFDLDHVVQSNTVLLNVHGQTRAIPYILRLTQDIGWFAVDCSEGEFLEPDTEA